MYVFIYLIIYLFILWILDKSIEIKREGYYEGN